MKYKAGDEVTAKFKLCERMAEDFNNGRSVCLISVEDIIKHESAPFYWDDVKPGMAFKTKQKQIWWYIGPCWSVKGMIVVSSDKNNDCSDQLHFACPVTHGLIRAPEHDIKVKS